MYNWISRNQAALVYKWRNALKAHHLIIASSLMNTSINFKERLMALSEMMNGKRTIEMNMIWQ
jgi:hypothetical protein